MLIFLLLFVGVITECDHHHLYSTARFPWPPNFIFPSYPSQLRVPPGFLRVSSGFGTAVHDASAARSILATIYQSTNPSWRFQMSGGTAKNFCKFLCNLSLKAIFILGRRSHPCLCCHANDWRLNTGSSSTGASGAALSSRITWLLVPANSNQNWVANLPKKTRPADPTTPRKTNMTMEKTNIWRCISY